MSTSPLCRPLLSKANFGKGHSIVVEISSKANHAETFQYVGFHSLLNFSSGHFRYQNQPRGVQRGTKCPYLFYSLKSKPQQKLTQLMQYLLTSFSDLLWPLFFSRLSFFRNWSVSKAAMYCHNICPNYIKKLDDFINKNQSIFTDQ